MLKRELIIAPISSINNHYIMALYEENKIMELSIANDFKLDKDEQLNPLLVEVNNGPIVLGDIYIGRVEKVVPSLNAAFIEIAPGVPCYYPLKEACSAVFTKKIGKKPLCVSEELLVQINREAQKSKQASVTSKLSFKGNYCVVTSGDTTIGVSSKIEKKTKEVMANKLTDFRNEVYGLVVRTNASKVDFDLVLNEITTLGQELEQLIHRAQTRTCFSQLKKESDSVIQFISNSTKQELDKITVEGSELYNKIKDYLQNVKPEYLGCLKEYTDTTYPMEKLHGLETRLGEGLHKKVWLKSGAFLIIEHTEAMTVIDVNSGKCISKKSEKDQYLKINIEASIEIARQLRLRNISGIVLVDFINMNNKEHMNEVLSVLKNLVKQDKVPVNVLGATQLELVEITRKKVNKNLWESVNECKNNL